MNSRGTYWSKNRPVQLLAMLLAICLFAVGAWVLQQRAHAASLEEGCESVREAVLSSARQCCAIEGTYPSSLEYLEEHYALSVNQSDYLISYDAFSSNMLPEVTVMVR